MGEVELSGSVVAARVAATTLASTAGSWPNVWPPALTFGQLTFISMAATGAPAAVRRFATSAYSSTEPPQMLTIIGGTAFAPVSAPTVST